MRLNAAVCAGYALLFLALSQPAYAICAHPVRRHASKEQIEALEEQWRMAVMNNDASLMDKLLSDDFVGISMSGQVNTKQMQLDRLRSHSLKMSRLDLSDVKVKLVGSVAIVTSMAQIEGQNDGQEMHGTFRYTRVYQRLPNGLWKVTNFEATRVPFAGDRIGRSPRPQPQPPASASPSPSTDKP